ncbi:MAG: dynamin family protein [Planctomycetaceae bacterium]|nr:dynamin family protein [Planctomycetaceae bacterium]
MSDPQLAHLELLARMDDLVARANDWNRHPAVWRPQRAAQGLLQRVLERIQSLKIRLEAPIVCATFGGTGTGKSSLVNALVGEDVTRAGRERPTTRKPVLIAHPKTSLSALGLPLDDFEIVLRDADLLRDLVILDCPDPDTSEAETAGSNLERLHALLPYCDVLVYVSTQQKYRSARVADELGQAAAGCRIVFVQTHADLDEDIREDWRRQLRAHYEIPDVFFVDSVRGLREQRSGQRPSGDLARLQDLLTSQLAASERVRIRRANVVDLLAGALDRCENLLSEHAPQLASLERALVTEQQSLSARLADRLQSELLDSRHLWERRLTAAVAETWGTSPFSALLRVYQGLGSLVTSVTLFRARSAAQMALIGAVQGGRWWLGRRDERAAEDKLQSAFCIDDEHLREAELVIQGHLRAAEIALAEGKHSLAALRGRAADVEQEFLGDAGRRVDGIIQRLAERNSAWSVRAGYELCWGAYLVFILYRVGKNFFYDSWLGNAPLLASEFYIPAALFLVLWAGVLIMSFTRRLRRGLEQEVRTLAGDLVRTQLAHGLFPDVEVACRAARTAIDELRGLQSLTQGLQNGISSDVGRLGAVRPGRVPAPVN